MLVRILMVCFYVCLLSACSTAKSIRRVREASATDGFALQVAADVATLAGEVPDILRALGYRDIALETRAGGSVQVLAATPSSWDSFGRGVRVIAEPISGQDQGGSLLRLVFARRLPNNGSEDLETARETLAKALVKHFGSRP